MKFLLLLLLIISSSCAPPNYNNAWEDPQASAYYYNLGLRKSRKGEYQEAIHYFRQALASNPNSISARDQLALAHFRQGDEYFGWRNYEKAGSEYRAALELNPNLVDAKRALAEAEKQIQYSILEK